MSCRGRELTERTDRGLPWPTVPARPVLAGVALTQSFAPADRGALHKAISFEHEAHIIEETQLFPDFEPIQTLLLNSQQVEWPAGGRQAEGTRVPGRRVNAEASRLSGPEEPISSLLQEVLGGPGCRMGRWNCQLRRAVPHGVAGASWEVRGTGSQKHPCALSWVGSAPRRQVRGPCNICVGTEEPALSSSDDACATPTSLTRHLLHRGWGQSRGQDQGWGQGSAKPSRKSQD